MRPYLWYRNFLLFAGIVFSSRLGELNIWSKVLAAFVIFCGISGMTYIFNDIVDKDRDRKSRHNKAKRPIADGKLSIFSMSLFTIIGTLFFVFISFRLTLGFGFLCLAYCMLSVLYSLILKHIIIAGEVAKAFGFVLRAIAGCVVINQSFSSWLVVCTFLVALMLSLAKKNYENSETAWNSLTETSGGMAIMAYMLWAVGKDTLWIASWKYNLLLITIPFVCYALLRYIYLVNTKRVEPEVSAIKDMGVLISSVTWICLIGIIAILK